MTGESVLLISARDHRFWQALFGLPSTAIHQFTFRLFAALVIFLGVRQTPGCAEIALVGSISIQGDTHDLSGLPGSIGQGTPHNLFGAIGALEHLGGNRFLAMPDRGPLDGASQFQCRLHQIELILGPSGTPTAGFRLLQTSLLKTEDGDPLVGALNAFDLNSPSKSRRFDPEAVRITGAGAALVSDEYGPFLYEFDLSGSRTRIFPTPSEFAIAHPSADSKLEDQLNATGRAANAGWEGIAITPDGRHVMLATQKSLLQDRVVVDERKMPTRAVRLLEIDLQSGSMRQFVYALDNELNGISELLAINSQDFLLLERDGLKGTEARTKRIYRISTKGATDISSIKSLASPSISENVVAVEKTLLVDLLDPRWGFVGAQCPEKWEGLAFGPNLADGRHLLWVAVDNDYVPADPTRFHAFSIDAIDLPRFSRKK